MIETLAESLKAAQEANRTMAEALAVLQTISVEALEADANVTRASIEALSLLASAWNSTPECRSCFTQNLCSCANHLLLTTKHIQSNHENLLVLGAAVWCLEHFWLAFLACHGVGCKGVSSRLASNKKSKYIIALGAVQK